MRKFLFLSLINILAIHGQAQVPAYWNQSRQVTFHPATIDWSELGIKREHNPATAERQGAREFGIELEKADDADFYLIIARDRRQLESFLNTDRMERIGEYNQSYWQHFVQSFTAIRGGGLVSEDHLLELNDDKVRLDYFYDGCLDQPDLLSASASVSSGYQDTQERSANYAQQADLTTFLLDHFRSLFIRFFDVDGDDLTDIQVSRARPADRSNFLTSFLYDNPMLGNELNTSPLSVVYPLVQEYDPGSFGPRNNVHHCWVKVSGGLITKGDIRSPFIPDAVRIAVAGDSFSSGEGCPNPWYDKYNNFLWGLGDDNFFAHRSYLSHWHLAIKRAHRKFYDNRATEHKTGIYHDDQSWSGAIIYDFDPNDHWYVRPTSWMDYYGDTSESANMRKGATTFARQINEFKQANYDLLCFSHGGNDAGFADLISQLLKWDDYTDIASDWRIDMNEPGGYRDYFAQHYDYSGFTTETAPPLEMAYDFLKTKLLNYGANYFNDRVFENFLISKYPNPVGYPAGNLWDSGTWEQFQRCFNSLGIEFVEADIICDELLDLINGPVDNLREVSPERITIIGANGSSMHPVSDSHQRGSMASTPDRLFAPVPQSCTDLLSSSLWDEADEDPTKMYWFHPNKMGQELIWYEDQLVIESYLNLKYTRTRYSALEHPRYNSNANRVDLSLELAELENVETADGNSALKLNLRVKNLSQEVTNLPVNLLLKFDFNGSQISIPVYNYLTGENVMIPQLEPDESVILDDVIFNSSYQCTGTDFLVSQLRIFIGKAPHILKNLSDYDPQVGNAAWWVTRESVGNESTFMRRVCGKVNLWNLHYGSDTKFSFYLPWQPNGEYNELVDNNFGAELSTWDINGQVVEDLKECYRISFLDCYKENDWLFGLFSKGTNDIVSLASVETRMKDLLHELNLRPSALYPILDTIEEGPPRTLIPLEIILKEASSLLEFKRKGLLGDAPLVMFPYGVENMRFEFPDHPNIKVSYSGATRLNELFVFDSSILRAELVLTKNGKTFRQPLDLELPSHEYGIDGLGNAPTKGWEAKPLQLIIPDGFSGNNLQFVAVDPLTNAVLKSTQTNDYNGTLGQFFENLYFSKGSAKLSINHQSSSHGKGYWLNDSESIGAVESEIESLNERSAAATIKLTLRGLIDPELVESEANDLRCILKSDSSNHRIPVTIEKARALNSTTYTLSIRFPMSTARSEFHIIEVTGTKDRVLAVAPLGTMPLIGKLASKVPPYLHTEDRVEIALSSYLDGQIPEFLYRDPIDGIIPNNIKLDVESKPSAVGVYPAKLTVSNSRKLESEKNIVLVIREDPIPDSDRDGLDDKIEKAIGTDPHKKDTDNDGLSDRIEFINGFVDLIDHPIRGNFRFINNELIEFDTIIGKRYQVETSVDLINWEPFGDKFQSSQKTMKIRVEGKKRAFFIRAKQL